jgi:hypothetical protein
MNERILRVLGAVLLLFLVACDDSMSAGAVFDPDVDFGKYDTFAWEAADPLPTGDPRPDANPFFVARIQEAVTGEFAARGIERVESDPSVLVHYHASVRDRLHVYEVDRRAGYEVPEYGPGVEVYQYDEGILLVDIVDAETLRVVWRGWARADVTRALEDTALLERLVQEAARAMFKEFPREIRVEAP